MLLLSSLSLASVAFGAWTVGGASYLLDGGSLQVAPILDASKYVSDAGFTCTDSATRGSLRIQRSFMTEFSNSVFGWTPACLLT